MSAATVPFYKLERGDKLIFLLYFVLLSALLLLNEDAEDSWKEDLYACVVFAGDVVILVYFIIFKWLKQLRKIQDYLWFILKIILLTCFLLGLQAIIFYTFIDVKPDDEGITLGDVVGTLIVIFLLTGVLLSIILVKKGIETQIQMLKNESLQKSNELRILKSQIDPHFLFNNLNTLDALIETNVQKAKPYIQRLAKLYQYLLVTKDEDTVSLEVEMDFAEDYIYLIKERFGDNYQFEIFDERKIKEERFIPPCAIQTVFENIVKHNNASRSKPIITEVKLQEEQLVVSNKIRPKKEPMVSFGIGLSNLQSRYQILCNRPLKVQLDTRFTIILPLIKKLNEA